jgi:hypothetical protein
MQQAVQFLSGPLGQQFDDPAFRQAAVKIDRMLNDGEDGGDLSAGDLYEFATRLFTRELQKGVGEQLPDGGVITSKRIVQALEDGDNIMLELDIHARAPDGTEYDYRAPVTRNRSSDAADEVLMIPISQIRDRLKGASYMAQGIEQAGGREQVLQMLQMPEGEAQEPMEEPAQPQMGMQGAQPSPAARMGLMGPGGAQ